MRENDRRAKAPHGALLAAARSICTDGSDKALLAESRRGRELFELVGRNAGIYGQESGAWLEGGEQTTNEYDGDAFDLDCSSFWPLERDSAVKRCWLGRWLDSLFIQSESPYAHSLLSSWTGPGQRRRPPRGAGGLHRLHHRASGPERRRQAASLAAQVRGFICV